VDLAFERVGDGVYLVLAHGLSATRRYVLHGSRVLERSGYRVTAYDARGHGASAPAPDPSAYGYPDFISDLKAVLDGLGIRRAVLAGVSMGAAATAAFALAHPERVSALVQITPAHLGRAESDAGVVARWDSLADALEREGADGFLRAYGDPPVDRRFRSLIKQAIRQRLECHEHPEAVAAAIRALLRSRAFDGPEALTGLVSPTLIVASRDDLDLEHPYAVAQRYRELIPDAELVVEEPGDSPLAWRGTHLSRAIARFLSKRGVGPAPVAHQPP
jgi:pimeloyl-ACP methyl ester carboxylesterase